MEAQAVYHCQQVQGPSVGEEGIMKIRMQIPPPKRTKYTYEERCQLALTDLRSFITRSEMNGLRWLNDHGCSSTPKLYSWIRAAQNEDMAVPGGYVVLLVMQKVPGTSLVDFWSRPLEMREKIRAAFRCALTEVYSHGVIHWDRDLRNLHYDEENDKCYVLDFESAVIKRYKEDHAEWDDFYEWETCGLVKRDSYAKKIL